MTEKKFKRVIVASTVGAVLLLITLLMIMVYQLISIKVYNDNIAYLEERIAYYNQLIDSGTDVFEARLEREWIEKEAQRLGYVYQPNN